jgi:hypothetical protein
MPGLRIGGRGNGLEAATLGVLDARKGLGSDLILPLRVLGETPSGFEEIGAWVWDPIRCDLPVNDRQDVVRQPYTNDAHGPSETPR